MASSQSNKKSARRLSALKSNRTSKFTLLPPELRLKVWNCATEPRVISLVDLVNHAKAYPLLSVTQLNTESRYESRVGYEPVGQGSYLDFSKDILLCDYNFTEQTAHSLLENIAPRMQRVIFWDCIPDERFCRPDEYSDYLSTFYRQSHFGEISFDKFWFPNVKELWFVKVGDVDERWMVKPQRKAQAPYNEQLSQMAREFRYWVDENIIEMSQLDLNESESRMVFREGRCARANCRELNNKRDHIISKVNFMDGTYVAPNDGRIWSRIESPAPGEIDPFMTGEFILEGQDLAERRAKMSPRTVERLRWMLVERALTLPLRCDWPTDEVEVRRGNKD